MNNERELEDRVVANLGSAGLIRRDRPMQRMIAGLAVGALAGSALVLGLQSLDTSNQSEMGDRTYMLALYTTPAYRPAADSRSRASEYGRWAADHAEGAAVVTGGAELGNELASLGPARAAPAELAGYFLVEAQSSADAVALARTNPHLRYGGTVVIRGVSG